MSKRISVRVPHPLAQRVEAVASREGKRVSEVVREALELRVLIADVVNPSPPRRAPPAPLPPQPRLPGGGPPWPPPKPKLARLEIPEELERLARKMKRELEEEPF